jgi:HlyD family secretion protein
MNVFQVCARLVVLCSLFVIAGCGNNGEEKLQGWIEADLIFVGADESGRVETLSVREGDNAAVGTKLFSLDADQQKADVFSGEATVANTQQTFARAQELLKNRTGTQKDFDAAQAANRDAEAKLNWARTRLARRNVTAPVAGVIQQIYYRPGELVPVNRPVVALLPPGNIKVRFYVPEGELPRIAVNDMVKIACDGCAPDLNARVSFISRSSEYTPPVIYSQEERAKLVFLIEARPETPDAFRVGQPVTVVVAPKAK